MLTDIELRNSFLDLVHLYLKLLTDIRINYPYDLVMLKVKCLPLEITEEIVRNPRKIRIIKQLIESIVDFNKVSKVELPVLQEWLKDPPRRAIRKGVM